MEFNDLQKECYATARQNGFLNGKIDVPQEILLVICELAEATEELRKFKTIRYVYYDNLDKPLGFEAEISDAMMRLMSLSEGLGLNIEDMIIKKNEFNKTRKKKHGKKF
jgi:hypothetical protein